MCNGYSSLFLLFLRLIAILVVFFIGHKITKRRGVKNASPPPSFFAGDQNGHPGLSFLSSFSLQLILLSSLFFETSSFSSSSSSSSSYALLCAALRCSALLCIILWQSSRVEQYRAMKVNSEKREWSIPSSILTDASQVSIPPAPKRTDAK